MSIKNSYLKVEFFTKVYYYYSVETVTLRKQMAIIK